MYEDDIKELDNLTHKYKIRYDVLDSEFKEDDDKIKNTSCYVPINLSALVFEMENLRDSFVDDTDFELHAAISILNLYAHYKHYFKSRGACNTIIIGFVKDLYVYKKYNKILDRLYNYSVFFQGIYTIPDITQNHTPMNFIVACSMEYMKQANTASTSNIFIVSSAPIDRQLMFAFPTNVAATLFKNSYTHKEQVLTKEEYMRKICKKPEVYDKCPRKSDIDYINFFLGRYFGSLRIKMFYRKDITETIHFKSKSIDKKMKVVMDFLDKVYDPLLEKNMIHQLMIYMRDSGEILDRKEYEPLKIYELEFDYHMQSRGTLLRIIAPLIESWIKKIKDYEVNRQSENYKNLIAHQLSTNWLA